MTKTFTTNDVIRFVYDDLDLPERQQINNAILMNVELLEYYQQIEELRNSISGLKLKPSENCTDKILNYSKNYSVQTT